MNKRIDYSNLGGFPGTQKTFDFMQTSYRGALGGLASLCGNKVIVTGVQVVGGNVTSGWIVYNGEMIPFVGGGYSANVVIEETAESATFQDNSVHNVYFTKTATCGTPGTFPFTDLKRLNTLQQMWLPGDVKEVDCTPEYVTANFNSTGLGIGERIGWAVCNGQNGTKNRGGRVGVGMNYPVIVIDPGDNVWDSIYNTVGLTGGEKKHTLTVGELAKHKHQYSRTRTDPFTDQYEPNRMNDGNDVGLWTGDSVNTAEAGNNEAHENRQPFIVTLYIQKL